MKEGKHGGKRGVEEYTALINTCFGLKNWIISFNVPSKLHLK